MLRVERLLVASDSYPGFVQHGPENSFTSLSFITCMHILRSVNPDYFVNNITVELSYVTDTFPASLSTITWLDGLAQYANNTSS